MDDKHALTTAPIFSTIWRLSIPNMLAMAAGALVTIAETSYIGYLGTFPLAGIALVFPMVMLQQMISAGSMGLDGRSFVGWHCGRHRTLCRFSARTMGTAIYGQRGSDCCYPSLFNVGSTGLWIFCTWALLVFRLARRGQTVGPSFSWHPAVGDGGRRWFLYVASWHQPV